MNLKSFLVREYSEHVGAIRAAGASLVEPFMMLCAVAEKALNEGNQIMLIGNGGSAADAQHFAAALAGKGGGELEGLADPLLIVPSGSTARIQAMHIFLGHILCDVLEERCGK